MSAEKKPIHPEDQSFQTPMMQQYMDIKAQYPDCLLFFRLGDFYELFLEDAQIGAHVLGITLTRRSRGKDGTIPMCGVPFHSVDMYIPRLVEAGYKIAIAEQMTSPKDTPNLVIRKVVRVITSGTILEGRTVNEKESAYVCALCVGKKTVALACADIATGQFFVTSREKDSLTDLIHQYRPKEIILSTEQYNTPNILGLFESLTGTNISAFLDWTLWTSQSNRALTQHFQVSSLLGFGLSLQTEIDVAAALLGYLTYTQQGNISHIQSLYRLEEERFLGLDATTIESLELFQSSMDKTTQGSLFDVINQTQTVLGTRMLKDWLLHPLSDRTAITNRLEDVELFAKNPNLLSEVRAQCAEIVDIERLLAKLSVGIGNARDMVSLKNALEHCEQVLQATKAEAWKSFDALTLVGKSESTQALISEWILDDPRGITKEGGMIKPEADPTLAELKKIFGDTTSWLSEFEKKERTRTGISTLKVGENSVFGFYIEVSKAHAQTLKTSFGYERKQTLVNAERYITTELKEKEQIALTAREAISEREFELFTKVTSIILEKVSTLQQIARLIAHIDCISSLAQLSIEKKYVKPTITTDKVLSIKNGRHPVVEHFIGTQFVPNPTDLTQAHRFLLLTGPNMAGKSTYIRQVALIVLLAHMGSFVPADHAIIPLCNRIFSRIGASDALHKGLSTFMVEMTETARIIRHLTERSLVIFDEIGRGTGTQDGMSIAQAIAEHVATLPAHPFVFFATHYHELAQLHTSFSSIKNASMAVTMHKGQIIFLRTLQDGSTNESYGIEVAAQAGIPQSVIRRAEELKRAMKMIELQSKTSSPTQNDEVIQEMIVKLSSINLDEITPKEALETLATMQSQLS